jgi:hypothetical protein
MILGQSVAGQSIAGQSILGRTILGRTILGRTILGRSIERPPIATGHGGIVRSARAWLHRVWLHRVWLRRVSLLRLWPATAVRPRRLELIDRISLGPRHSVSLIVAEGVRVLVATSPDGPAAMLPIGPIRPTRTLRPIRPTQSIRPPIASPFAQPTTPARPRSQAAQQAGRVSW